MIISTAEAARKWYYYRGRVAEASVGITLVITNKPKLEVLRALLLLFGVELKRSFEKIVIWLILPVVICLS